MRGKREEETSVEQKKRATSVQVRIRNKNKNLMTYSLLSEYYREVEQISQIF